MKQNSRIYAYTEEKYFKWASRMANKYRITMSEFINCLIKHAYSTKKSDWKPRVEYKERLKK